MDWEAAVMPWEYVVNRRPGMRNPQSEAGRPAILPEARLAYARQAMERVRGALLEGRSRWSVVLPRPPWATAEMLDLSQFNLRPLGEPLKADHRDISFRELASGVQVLGGTSFDVQGILRLDRARPVTIPIGRPCRRIHFLQAASQPVSNFGVREPVARYQVTYTNGDAAAVTLQNPEDVPPYSWDDLLAVSPLTREGFSPGLRCALVWSGCAPAVGRQKEILFLTKTTWELPARPGGPSIKTLELRAEPARSVPLIFAITVE